MTSSLIVLSRSRVVRNFLAILILTECHTHIHFHTDGHMHDTMFPLDVLTNFHYNIFTVTAQRTRGSCTQVMDGTSADELNKIEKRFCDHSV